MYAYGLSYPTVMPAHAQNLDECILLRLEMVINTKLLRNMTLWSASGLISN